MTAQCSLGALLSGRTTLSKAAIIALVHLKCGCSRKVGAPSCHAPRHALHAVDAESVTGCDRKRQKKVIKAAKASKTLPVKGGDLPVGGDYPLTCLGVTSEAFGDALGDYVRSNPDSSLKREPLL